MAAAAFLCAVHLAHINFLKDNAALPQKEEMNLDSTMITAISIGAGVFIVILLIVIGYLKAPRIRRISSRDLGKSVS